MTVGRSRFYTTISTMNKETKSDDLLRHATDSELASAFQAGEVASFTEIDHRFRPRIFQFLRRRVGSHETAEDLTQETFLRAFSSLKTLRDGVFLAGWLKQIAYRVYVDWIRRVSKDVSTVCYDESSCDVENGAGQTFLIANSATFRRPTGGDFSGTNVDETPVLRDERRNVWRIARKTLGAVEFQALWLRYEDDLSDREIANSLGKTPGAVRVILSRAKKRLSERLKRQD